MIPLKNKKIALLGVMEEGLAMIRFLASQGAQISAYGLAYDEERERILKNLEGIPFQLNTEEIPTDGLKSAELVIISSGGERRYKNQIEWAHQKGIPVLSDLELACEYYTAPIIAVTGTNGKTTVVHLLQTAFELAGKKIVAAGGDFENFGDSLLRKEPYEIVLLELNSSRLMRTTRFRPNIAVFLNLYPGHSERHGSLEEYGDAKAKIFTHQTGEDFLVFQASQEVMQVLQKNDCKAQGFGFSVLQEVRRGAYFDSKNKQVIFILDSEKSTFSYEKHSLKGLQNLENILAVICVAKICRLSDSVIQQLIETAKPLPHRLELVQKIDGIPYINDARSTNIAATVTALLSCRDHSTILIAGGEYKGGQLYENLNPLLKQKVKVLIIFGENRLRLFEKWKEAAETYVVPSLKEAVELASQKAQKGEGVLFSPACSPELHAHATSKERGEEFRKLVNEMAERSRTRKSSVKRI